MKDQLQTIRSALKFGAAATNAEIKQALTALAQLEAMAGEQSPKFWYRPVGNDGLYEGPVHHNSVGGKMLRDEKPGEWVPLFAGAAPVAQQPQYTHADVTSAHTEGYKLGLMQVDRPTKQPQADAVPNTLQKAEAHLLNLIGEYWGLAYAEGAEGRNHDTEDGAAQRTHAAIAKAVNDLIAAASSAPKQAEAVRPIEQERREAEQQYSIAAFNYPDAPIGSRDWTLYWAGWLARSTAFKEAPQQAEAVPPTHVPGLAPNLDVDEDDPIRLWAEIWRLREAVKGPDGYATWQDAATAERSRRVKAENERAEDHLKLHAIEELCQLGYTVKDGELFPPDHLHKLMEAAGHPLAASKKEAGHE